MDLVDYLLQYCIGKTGGGNSTAKYMEKTALGWHRDGVTTVSEAKNVTGARFDKRVYAVMRALGLDNAPTPTEADYIMKWFGDFAFSEQLVSEACRQTVLKVQKNRLLYCDGILKSWHDKNVRTLDDVSMLDAAAKTAKLIKEPSKKQKKGGVVDTTNRFNRFTQNDYDFEALKERIVSN